MSGFIGPHNQYVKSESLWRRWGLVASLLYIAETIPHCWQLVTLISPGFKITEYHFSGMIDNVAVLEGAVN
jgi:hypothetical protein